MSTPSGGERVRVKARNAGFALNVYSLGVRAVRSLPRDIETLVPSLFIPVFFYLVNVGIFSDFVGMADFGIEYHEFQIPVAIMFAVTGLSRASVLVLDIQRGYFDRLSLAPVNRVAMLVGMILADMLMAVLVTIPVLVLSFFWGVFTVDNISWFDTGVLGFALFIVITVAWSLAYNLITYGIALKTGNPAIVNTSFIIFFPVLFFSTLYLPLDQLTGWLGAVARVNPTTYVLDGMRSLLTPGWDWVALGLCALSIAIVFALTLTFALWGLNARLRRK